MTLTEGMFENLNKPDAELPPVAEIVQAEVQPEPQPEPEQPAPVVPEPEVVPEPVPEAPKTEQTVPLSVFLKVRDEAKAIERRNQEFEARQAAQPQTRDIPDPIDDPNGYAAYQSAQMQDMLMRERFSMSKEIASQQYGADTVETARQWAMERAAKDPAFDLALGQQQHPLGWIVQQHKRDGLFSQIGDDPDAWVRKRAVELGIGIPAPAAVAAPVAALGQPAPVAVAQPPRSLASAPGSGGGVIDVPTGPMSALGAVFK